MMSKVVVFSVFLLLASPVWAESPLPLPVAEQFDPDQPFGDAAAKNFLRSLLNEAIDRLEDHLELQGSLQPDPQTGERQGRFGLRLYPHGKSKSDEHLDAETWFRFSPDRKRGEWHFRLQSIPELSGTI